MKGGQSMQSGSVCIPIFCNGIKISLRMSEPLTGSGVHHETQTTHSLLKLKCLYIFFKYRSFLMYHNYKTYFGSTVVTAPEKPWKLNKSRSWKITDKAWCPINFFLFCNIKNQIVFVSAWQKKGLARKKMPAELYVREGDRSSQVSISILKV